MRPPLYLVFLWHMHQPYYRDPLKGIYRLPWVRLHGTKDYLDMVSILDEFPLIRQNFNLVPSLLEQIKDYVENNAKDEFLEISLKEPSGLNENEKVFILENFFLANWNTMIKPFPRYRELLGKRGHSVSRDILSKRIRYFSDQDIRDLQVLFNLVWIDPELRRKDSILRELEKKGSNYNEDDKKYIISKHLEILKSIIPKYREVAERKQIELSVSPFYHPILPLLCDTDSAKISLPHIKLPSQRFRSPEDAREQVKRAIDYFESIFDFRPEGLWPSEGSISEEVLRILRELGIKWTASDEDVLSGSTGVVLRDQEGRLKEPGFLYRPHFFEDIGLFFRDHRLSDLIGFVYSGWKPEDAARDLISKLKDIHERLDNKPYVVTIIMDGENAWEYYENDGRDFLTSLYTLISSQKWLKTITINEYLNEYGLLWKDPALGRIHPGSWINANFSVWIGHEEDNLAWDYLKLTRDELLMFERTHPEIDTSSAWKLIYIAEGSDWNWWYGDEHVSETQEEFDELFRNNLIAVYRFMGKEPPGYLLVPILREDRAAEPHVTIRGFVTPKLDGLVSSYFEWLHAAQLDVSRSGGSMHKTETIFESIYYGFDRDAFYIRIDGKRNASEILSDRRVVITFLQPEGYRIEISPEAVILKELREGRWVDIKPLESGINEIIEIAVPFPVLSLKENDEVGFIINLEKGSDILERIPLRGHIRFTVPGPYFEAIMWQ